MQEYELIRHITTISTRAGKSKELNIISYNGDPPVLDLRVWKDGGYTSKGVTLTIDEIHSIAKALEERRETS